MTWPLGLSSSKKALMSKPISNEGRKERLMDKRTTDVPSNSNLGCQHTKAPAAAALSPFMNVLYPPYPRCEWCVKVGNTIGVYVPCSFEQWCGFFYEAQEPDKCKCMRRDLRLFPGGYLTNIYTGRLRPEVQPLTLLHTIFCEKGSPFVYALQSTLS